MPVEIKELNIKISLDNNNDVAGNAPAPSETSNGNSGQQSILVDIVVEKVLEILKARTER